MKKPEQHRWLDEEDLRFLAHLYQQGMVTRLLGDMDAAKKLLWDCSKSLGDLLSYVESREDHPSHVDAYDVGCGICGRIQAIPRVEE